MKRVLLKVVTCAIALLSFTPCASAAEQQVPLYVPPPGYTALPGAGIPQPKVRWRPASAVPGSGKFVENFNAVAAPFPGTVEQAANGARMGYSSNLLGQATTDVASTVCGLPVRTFTVDVPAGKLHATLVQQLMVKSGKLYVLTYSRESGTPANAAISQYMQSFCPPANGDIAKLSPPDGWINVPISFVPVETWQGHAGSIIQLMKGPATSSLADAAKAMSAALAQNSQSNLKSAFDFSAPQTGTLCGNPAVFVSLTIHMGRLDMVMHQAITQNATQAFGITYGHPTTVPDDPAALSSLKTLCANGTMPQ